jgi:hypothetical protein
MKECTDVAIALNALLYSAEHEISVDYSFRGFRMNAPLPFPAIAEPPHDPTSLLLNAHVGWRTASPGQL